MLSVYIPEDLDICKHFENMKDLEKAYYIIAYVRRGPALYKTCSTDWVPICQHKLQEEIGRFRPVLDKLKKIGILKCDETFYFGTQHKSKGYKLKTSLTKCKIVKYTFSVLKPKAPVLSPVSKKIVDCYSRLTIAEDISPVDMVGIGENGEIVPYDDFVQKIREQHWEASEDKHGRLYSIFTRLPSKLRKYLRLDGSPLVSRDISNSHPWLLGLVMAGTTYAPSKDKYYLPTFSLMSKSSNPIDHLKADALFSPSEEINIDKIYHKLDVFSDEESEGIEPIYREKMTNQTDVKQWISSAQHGSFYQWISNRHNASKKQSDKAKDKDKVKAEYLNVNGETKIQPEWFQRLFPNVAKFVRFLKKSDYKDFSRYLLSLEAKINLHCVAAGILKKYPEMPLLTIHDCFYTSQKWEAVLDAELQEQYSKLAVKPSFKAKNY